MAWLARPEGPLTLAGSRRHPGRGRRRVRANPRRGVRGERHAGTVRAGGVRPGSLDRANTNAHSMIHVRLHAYTVDREESPARACPAGEAVSHTTRRAGVKKFAESFLKISSVHFRCYSSVGSTRMRQYHAGDVPFYRVDEVREPLVRRGRGGGVGDLQSGAGGAGHALPGGTPGLWIFNARWILDKKLGWQLFTFVSEREPSEEIANVPGAPSMRRILNAAGKLPGSRCGERTSGGGVRGLRGVVAEHGGDREGLVSLA